MPSISIKSDDIVKLQKYFRSNPRLVEKYTNVAMKKSMFTLERESKIEAPVLTGRLRSSVSTNIKPLVSRLSVNVDYAVYVHDGTKRQKPNPFLDRASSKSEVKVQGFFEKALDNIINDIAKNG